MSADRIKRGRELAGLTQWQAAVLIDIPMYQLAEIELGTALLPDSKWAKMADTYGVTVPWLKGAKPHHPPELVKMLRESELRPQDQERILEVIGSMHTRES